MTNKKVDVYVVMEGFDVMGLYDSHDEAERMTNSYYDAVVDGPHTLEITDHSRPHEDSIGVHVIVEGEDVMGVYDSHDEAERMCNSYTDAEVTDTFILSLHKENVRA